MPEPWLMLQFAPSSSVNDIRLVLPSNWETNVRLVRFEPASLSVKRIGSDVTTEVLAALTSSHVADAGDAVSSHFTRRVCNEAINIALPDCQFTPMVGSPAELPNSPGAA